VRWYERLARTAHESQRKPGGGDWVWCAEENETSTDTESV